MIALSLFLGALLPMAAHNETPSSTWWKGNMHSHSLWSDGDDFPEMVADWYKRNGYHFLMITEHNVFQLEEMWVDERHPSFRSRPDKWETALRKYHARLGDAWIEQRGEGKALQVRLQPLFEYAGLFEEPGRFMLMNGEEITPIMARVRGYMGRDDDLPQVDLIVSNPASLIQPWGGASVQEVMQNNLDFVQAQRRETGQVMLAHVPHPNYRWAITAEDLAAVAADPLLFEIYNGGGVNNYGDAEHLSTEALWDIALALRLLRRGEGQLYGVAVDDGHYYHEFQVGNPNPGRGWVVVRAPFLTPERILNGLIRGDFYASTGVTIDDIRFDGSDYALKIAPQEGVTYRTQFIGTRTHAMRRLEAGGQGRTSVELSSAEWKIGEILAEIDGLNPTYTPDDSELYVRAKVISSKLKDNPYAVADHECAWTQPVRVFVD
ncbi:MAG: histidinol-phosphatase [Alphaproteobacteria bacterium]|nr:histidinol-phosphatase [Alphaproteobacteria bacterium]